MYEVQPDIFRSLNSFISAVIQLEIIYNIHLTVQLSSTNIHTAYNILFIVLFDCNLKLRKSIESICSKANAPSNSRPSFFMRPQVHEGPSDRTN